MTEGQQILVTGGAGFIGSHLVERLLRERQRVVVIDDLSTGNRENLASVATHPNLRLIIAKISTCAELPELVAQSAAIYHLAAAVGVDLVIKEPIHVLATNQHETEVLLAQAAKNPVPTLVASTSEVYGKSEKAVFREDDDLLIGPPHHSRWGYACSKLMDEFLALAYARQYRLPVVIARLFNTVGPRQTGRFGMVLPRFIAATRQNKPLKVFGDGRQTRCFCYVLDTVEALIRLLHTPAAFGQIFNVGGTEEVTIHELAQKVIDTLHSTSAIELVPYEQAYAPGFEDMRRRKPSVDKLAQTIGFRPQTSLQEIIQRTVASD